MCSLHDNQQPPAPTIDPAQMIRDLAKSFIERAAHLNYKGKKRDDAALDFWCGAVRLAELSGNQKMAEHLTRAGVFFVASRGFFGIKELAEEA
jgi:hypothetical protein